MRSCQRAGVRLSSWYHRSWWPGSMGQQDPARDHAAMCHPPASSDKTNGAELSSGFQELTKPWQLRAVVEFRIWTPSSVTGTLAHWAQCFWPEPADMALLEISGDPSLPFGILISSCTSVFNKQPFKKKEEPAGFLAPQYQVHHLMGQCVQCFCQAQHGETQWQRMAILSVPWKRERPSWESPTEH